MHEFKDEKWEPHVRFNKHLREYLKKFNVYVLYWIKGGDIKECNTIFSYTHSAAFATRAIHSSIIKQEEDFYFREGGIKGVKKKWKCAPPFPNGVNETILDVYPRLRYADSPHKTPISILELHGCKNGAGLPCFCREKGFKKHMDHMCPGCLVVVTIRLQVHMRLTHGIDHYPTLGWFPLPPPRVDPTKYLETIVPQDVFSSLSPSSWKVSLTIREIFENPSRLPRQERMTPPAPEDQFPHKKRKYTKRSLPFSEDHSMNEAAYGIF